MELKLAFLGFGNVARAFVRLLDDRRRLLETQYDLNVTTTAIATARHGCITSRIPIDLNIASARVERGESLTSLPSISVVRDAPAMIESCDADIVFDTTPLDPVAGEPAVSYIRSALMRGISVVTANKGPIAYAYRELRDLASNKGASFRFEGTVMDGAPVFNLVERCLPGVRVLGFSGVLNSTSNLVLTRMEDGISFESALDEARTLGIAEANADFDIDGWDAAVKTVALANVLMNEDARPAEVARRGIRGVTLADVQTARDKGYAVRLIARACRTDEGLKMSVSPETLPRSSPLATATGTTNVLLIETDLMGELCIIENNPGVAQTAYALFSDMIQSIEGRV
jgi:homoserine dehydrogenase